jgi:adenylate cyclase
VADEPGKIRKLNRSERALKAARAMREILPGDPQYGDRLSTAGREPTDVAGRQIAESPGLMRELGLTALQVFQAASEAQGRGRGEVDLAILFTDLVGFSSWALEAGDELSVQLLRDVGQVIEPPVSEHGGKVVKRLGDGLMAVFAEPREAVDAALEAEAGMASVQVGGYEPELRAGIHMGRPRKVGGDYLGVDVNIAARLTEGASGGELLVSDKVLAAIDVDGLEAKKKRRFKAKGAPDDMDVYAVSRGG